MGTERIPSLLLKMSLPLMLSMLVQALYNIVDSIFVAKVSETALTAVSLAFPLQNLIIAFGVGTSIGMSSYMSRKLGEGKTEEAENAAGNGITLAFITWLCFVLMGIFVAKPFLHLFTDDPELLELSSSYARIVMILSTFAYQAMMCERILQSTGDAFSSMLSQMIGAVTNIILDPVFIFGYKMGVNGAAIATVIGQAVGFCVCLLRIKGNKFISLKPRHLKLEKRIVGQIYSVGVPTIITNAIGTVMTSAMNAILIGFSTTAVSVFSVYFKLQSFVFMPLFGLSAGMVPIIAFNYGARNKKRMMDTIKVGTIVGFIIMALGTIIFNLFPRQLLTMFSATDEMYRIGVPALKIISLCFTSAAIAICMGSSFQATGYGIGSMIVSICRQLLVLVPVSFVLSRVIGINGVWYSFLIAEVVGLGTSLIIYAYVYRTRIKPLDKPSLEDSLGE
ncbi:MAG: MATE family efflux transporter [Spirochaetales bacterium]|nr:MATE family efflux transporter [Candidatus Physcosoma equi]